MQGMLLLPFYCWKLPFVLQFLAFRLSEVKSNCEGLSKELNQTEVSYADRHAAER